MENLLLITGAGASHDVVSSNVRVNINPLKVPPLTKDIFSSGSNGLDVVSTCLKNNQIASQIGYHFNLCPGSKNKEKSLEKFLLNLKNSKSSMERAHYWAVPIYLYDLFHDISWNYLPTRTLPSNYFTLINELNKSKYRQISWLNLNYDLLADHALKIATKNQMDNLDEYMKLKTSDGLEIKYTKPHGSVDWFHAMNSEKCSWHMIRNWQVPSDFESYLDREVYKQQQLPSHKRNKLNRDLDKIGYPAISAPIGEYEFIYPKHIEEISKELNSETHILCIGFSALDTDILNIIKEKISNSKVKTVKRLKIVNKAKEDGLSAFNRIAKHCNLTAENPVFDGGFADFMENGISDWLNY